MGLLSDNSPSENLSALQLIIGDVLENWDKCILQPDGLEAKIGNLSLSRICLIGDRLFDGHSFPDQPGPFKRAAAVCALLRMFGEVAFIPMQGRDSLTLEERTAWLARFALASVPVTLDLMTASLDGQVVNLKKPWLPATLHLQVELLNWLRWLERPLAPGSVDPTQVDLSRLQRTVMGLALIIEQSYYLVNAKTDCDVMHKAGNCIRDIKENDVLWQDLTLFYTVESKAG